MNSVAIFNSSFRQVLTEARPVKDVVNETTKLPEHPLETGAVINDHKIINPAEVEVVFFVPAENLSSVFQTIKQILTGNELLTVQTKTASYSNMTIASTSHDETSDVYDSIFLTVKFRAVQLSTAQFGPLPASTVADPSKSSTIDRGEQQPKGASAGFELLFGK